MKLRWLRSGSGSHRHHVSFIAAENPAAAARVRRHIRTVVLRLCQFPQSGRVGQIPGTREFIVSGMPFVVIYRINEDYVEILRVFRTSMNWMSEKIMQ